ncbi:MAG: hypothetical protein ABI867_24525 [Kofleriaceae bacterium]
MIQRHSAGPAFAVSIVLHVALVVVAYLVFDPRDEATKELVDIELAPEAPPVEALPEEVARPPEQGANPRDEDTTDTASTVPEPAEPGGIVVDAGVDAPPDAPPDARRPDAAPDAAEMPLVAAGDAGVDAETVAVVVDDAGEPITTLADAGTGDATEVVAIGDAGTTDGGLVATTDPGSGSGSGSGSGAGEGSGSGSGALGTETGSGSGKPSTTNEPAVEGAATTAGTAANLLAYFPPGHTVTALIRFDRLRGSEWAARTERLLQPMPDYRFLFGPKEAKIYEKLETLVISTPRPADAVATTLVGRTLLPRTSLRDFLGAITPITWSPAKGGLLGKRTNKVLANDKRVFLSPFKGWFLLGQTADLPGLTAPAAAGNIDTIEATAKLPPWLAGIRAIEQESGADKGPALVVTIAMTGGRQELGEMDFGLGIKSFPLPERLSAAMELVKQGWLVRGNIRFASDAAATEFVTAAQAAQARVNDSRLLQIAMGAPAARVIAKLAFARTGPRVSYTTSISIADMRVLMTVAAAQLDGHFKAP